MAEESFLEVDPAYRSVVLDWFPELSKPNDEKSDAGDGKDNKNIIQPQKRPQKNIPKVLPAETKEVKVRNTLESIIRKKLKKKRKLEEEPDEIIESKDIGDDEDSKATMVSASKKPKTHIDIRERLLEGRGRKRRRRGRKNKGNTENLSSRQEGVSSENLHKCSPEKVEVDHEAKVNECDGTPVTAKDEDSKFFLKQKTNRKKHKKMKMEITTENVSKKEKVVSSRGFILSTPSVSTSQPEQIKPKKKKVPTATLR